MVLDHEEALLWKTYEGQPYRTFSREDFTVAIRRKVTPWTYICGIHHDPVNNKTFVLSGSSYEANPCLRVLNLSKTKLKPWADLHDSSSKRKNMLMRSSALFQSQIFITGSEDGLISIWTPSSGQVVEENEPMKEKAKRTNKNDKKPYERPK